MMAKTTIVMIPITMRESTSQSGRKVCFITMLLQPWSIMLNIVQLKLLQSLRF